MHKRKKKGMIFEIQASKILKSIIIILKSCDCAIDKIATWSSFFQLPIRLARSAFYDENFPEYRFVLVLKEHSIELAAVHVYRSTRR